MVFTQCNKAGYNGCWGREGSGKNPEGKGEGNGDRTRHLCGGRGWE